MAPLDIEARRLVASPAKRVSVVTAISPRAAIDMVFVLVNALSLDAQARGALWRAARRAGRAAGCCGRWCRISRSPAGLPLTDSVMQQVIGHGLAAKLSARLGEGMVNGLLTARLGLLAIDVVRPLPFHALPRPA